MMVVVLFLPVMMMLTAALFFMVVMMFFFPVMVMLTAAFLSMMVVMVMFFLLIAVRFKLCHHLRFQVSCPLDSGQNILSVQFLPGRSDDGCLPVVFSDQLNALAQLFLRNISGAAQHNGACMGNLINEELSEILNIHLTFGGIHNGDRAVERHILCINHILYCFHYVGKLPYSRGFDQDPLRLIGVHYFFQGSAEVPHQRAADAAGIHFLDLDPRFL